MAPEQILGEPLDRRADVFGLGVLLFELSTRTRLYSGTTNALAMKQILDGDVPEPGARRPGYPPGLAAIVQRALARDREARYPSARALVEDLDRLARAERWTMSTAGIGELVGAVRERGRAGAPGPGREATQRELA
jgi:serine/threonine protein kinase